MPVVKIHLTEHQLKALIYTLDYNGSLDLSEETFNGSNLEISMSPFGHFLQVKGYKTSDLGGIKLEIPNANKDK